VPDPSAVPRLDLGIAGGAVDPGKAGMPTSDWPQDWRARFAGDDADALKRLERFQAPADVFKSYRELERRVSSGELKAPPKPLAKEASPEQAAAWRKEQGLPDSAEAFVKGLALPNGVVPGEADRDMLEAFADTAFKNNWNGDQFNQAVAWYYEQQDARQAQQIERDEAFRQTALIELGKEWGPQQFQVNLNAMQNMLALFPQGVADSLLAGRMADGSRIGDNPGVLRALVHLARELNPAATVLPAGGDLSAKGIEGRMAEIQKMMGDYRSDYWQGPRAADLQKEFRELVEAQEKMRGRQAA
jgi:hypothetical protein